MTYASRRSFFLLLAFAAASAFGSAACTAPVTMGKECGGAACGGGSLIGVDLEAAEPEPGDEARDDGPNDPDFADALDDRAEVRAVVRFEQNAPSR